MFNIKKSSKLSCGVPILDPHFDPERHVNAPNGFQNGEVLGGVESRLLGRVQLTASCRGHDARLSRSQRALK